MIISRQCQSLVFSKNGMCGDVRSHGKFVVRWGNRITLAQEKDIAALVAGAPSTSERANPDCTGHPADPRINFQRQERQRALECMGQMRCQRNQSRCRQGSGKQEDQQQPCPMQTFKKKLQCKKQCKKQNHAAKPSKKSINQDKNKREPAQWFAGKENSPDSISGQHI